MRRDGPTGNSSTRDGDGHPEVAQEKSELEHTGVARYELSGKSRRGELETKANTHEASTGSVRGRRHELEADNRSP